MIDNAGVMDDNAVLQLGEETRWAHGQYLHMTSSHINLTLLG